jgi:cytochrome d ubiquinol oxidase subunit I
MYCAVFGTGISYMLKLVARGPEEKGDVEVTPRDRGQALRPARPLSASPDDIDPAIDVSVRARY